MSSNPLTPSAGLPADAAFGPTAISPAAPVARTPAQQPAVDPADFRLVIEEDKAAGSFVYKTVDPRTGEVVSQLPRQEILRLREAFNYIAGTVVKTKV